MDIGAWQPDPTRRHELRWWTGTQWSDQVADHGVTALDPLHALAAPAPSAPPPSTPPPQPPPQQAAPPSATVAPLGAQPAPTPPRSRSARTLTAVASAVGLVGIVAAATYFVTRDDETTTVGGATTLATSIAPASTLAPTVPTIAPTSTAPTTTIAVTTSTVPATTTPAAATNETILAALPGVGDVPTDWSRYSEPYTDLPPASGPGYGFCGGDDAVARAMAHGGTLFIDGPTWDLPTGGWFGVTVYAFGSAEEASAYLAATDQAANGCMTDPVQYDTTEGDLDFFDETVPDDASWHVAEGSLAFAEPTSEADELLRSVQESYASITLDGSDYSVTMTYISRWERHGRVVLQFWLYGNWNYQGWDEASPWAYQPDDAAVDAATAAIRPVIVDRLRAAGAL